jgi:hypothetical protein
MILKNQRARGPFYWISFQRTVLVQEIRLLLPAMQRAIIHVSMRGSSDASMGRSN